jgi:hypothetical protein
MGKRKNKNQRRGQAVNLTETFAVTNKPRRMYVDCSLDSYMEEDKTFIDNLCKCGVTGCCHLHSLDFNETEQNTIESQIES